MVFCFDTSFLIKMLRVCYTYQTNLTKYKYIFSDLYFIVVIFGITPVLRHDPIQGHCQVGSLTGAVHLSNNNEGVPRPAQCGQKPHIEQKGKC